MSSTFCSGHSLKSCLHVIQSDGVHAWNFGEIQQFLLSGDFGVEVSKAVEDINREADDDEHDGMTSILIGLPTVSAAMTALGPWHPAAPITVPIATALILGIWLHPLYQKTPPIIKFLMTYIVALVLIMESLFYHLPRPEALLRDPMLTPDVALQVVRSYKNSQVRRGVHAEIDAFVNLEQIVLTGKDDVLDEIKRLIAKYRRNGRAYKDWNEHQIEDDEPQLWCDVRR